MPRRAAWCTDCVRAASPWTTCPNLSSEVFCAGEWHLAVVLKRRTNDHQFTDLPEIEPPLKHGERLTDERFDGLYAKHGWGPARTWHVPRTAAPPLVIRMRLPVVAFQLLEVSGLEELRKRCSSAEVAQAAVDLDQAVGMAGIVVLGLLHAQREDAVGGEFRIALVVAFSEAGEPLTVEKLSQPEQRSKSETFATKISDHATVIPALLGRPTTNTASPL
jgi:hypothetical protein